MTKHVHKLALDHADIVDDLIAAAERMPTPVSLLWIANKAVQHTCEGKAAQAAICWCWCFSCSWCSRLVYTQHIINDLRVRPLPCIEPLTVGLPRQLTDLSRPLGILVEATIPGDDGVFIAEDVGSGRFYLKF